jgi:HSP20 family protein
MSLIKFNPVRDLLNVEREFQRFFNDFENRFGFPSHRESSAELESAVWTPMTDVYEDNNGYKLQLDLPGLKKDDVKISFSNGQLKISGERAQESEEKNGKYHRVERTFGKFYRSFTLPDKIKEAEIEAEFKNGQLTITIPKAEEVKPKELEIKVK